MPTSLSKRPIDWWRLTRGFFILTASIAAGCFWGEAAIKEDVVVDVMVNAVAIFAGVLLVVVGILGEPNLVAGGKWSVQLGWFKETHRKITRYNVVFAMFLLTLVFLVAALLADVKAGSIVGVWLARVAFAFFVASLGFSFLMPWELAAVQKERAEQIFSPKDRN